MVSSSTVPGLWPEEQGRGERGTLFTVEDENEFSFPRLIVVPLSSHAVDGVRKEKERLTAAWIAWRLNSFILFLSLVHLSTAMT